MAKTRTRDKVGQDTCLCHFVFLFLFSPRRMTEPAQMGTARSEREFREEGEEGWRGRSWQQHARFCSAGPRLLAPDHTLPNLYPLHSPEIGAGRKAAGKSGEGCREAGGTVEPWEKQRQLRVTVQVWPDGRAPVEAGVPFLPTCLSTSFPSCLGVPFLPTSLSIYRPPPPAAS